jgi:CelD/BcsL family acetyltransferase involved in cellulose biosynthesis
MNSQLAWTVEPAARLAQQIDVWNTLNAAHYRTPLLDGQFFQFLLREYGNGTERLAICRAGGIVIAATILSKNKFGWQSFQAMQSPLGAWVHNPQYSYEQLTGSLLRSLPGMPLTIGVTQQDPIFVARPAETDRMSTLDYIQTARLTIKGTFDEYWRARGSNLRQNLRTQRNKLSRESVVTRMTSVREPDAIGAAIDAYGRLESSGWKSGEGTAIHPDNPQGRLYRSWFEQLSAQGEAVVYQYFFNSDLVATDLWIHRGPTLILLKTTYDEKHKTFSPTMLMRQEIFEQVFAEGRFKRIEFYGRVVDWQRRWTEEFDVLYHVSLYRWPWLARLQRRRASSASAASAVVSPSQS